MSTHYPIVLAQIQYACAIRNFIRELLQAIIPKLGLPDVILGTDEQFHATLDAALLELDPHDADETDYRRAVVGVCCNEVSGLCKLLSEACCCTGFEKAAREYLDPRRFISLLLCRDRDKLVALTAAVRSGDRNIGRLLMRIGGILDGDAGRYDLMDAAAKRKAAVDARKLVAEVENLAEKLEAHKAEIVERVDAVGEKVDAVGECVSNPKPRRKRRRKYTEEARQACLACWSLAQTNASVRGAINTRVTHEAAFDYFKRDLAKRGVTKLSEFKAILHSAQTLESAWRVKELEARRAATREKPDPKDSACNADGEFAIIPPVKKVRTSAMAKTRKAMFALALALTWAGSARTAAESAAEVETSTPPPSLLRSVLYAA